MLNTKARAAISLREDFYGKYGMEKKKAVVVPFAAEKEEGREGNAVDIRNEEEDDVKEEVPPSQKSSNRGTGNFLVSRTTNSLLVRIKEKHCQVNKTEVKLISIKGSLDIVHADNKVHRSDSKANRKWFPINLTTVGMCSDDAYSSQSTDKYYMACRHAFVSTIRPFAGFQWKDDAQLRLL